MMKFKKLSIASTALFCLCSLHAQGSITLGAWDFNDETPVGDQSSLPDYETTTGSQAGAGGISLVINEATGQSDPFELNSSGTTVGDTWNSPADAGNAVGFLHGSRIDGTTIEVHFDASSLTTDVSLNFAINKIDPDGVDTYQASYSTDGGTSFTSFGSAITFDNSWNEESINFGLVFSGAANSVARFELTNGGPAWNEDHKSYMDNVSLTAVPEPSTYAALAGLLALGVVFWRRRRS